MPWRYASPASRQSRGRPCLSHLATHDCPLQSPSSSLSAAGASAAGALSSGAFSAVLSAALFSGAFSAALAGASPSGAWALGVLPAQPAEVAAVMSPVRKISPMVRMAAPYIAIGAARASEDTRSSAAIVAIMDLRSSRSRPRPASLQIAANPASTAPRAAGHSLALPAVDINSDRRKRGSVKHADRHPSSLRSPPWSVSPGPLASMVLAACAGCTGNAETTTGTAGGTGGSAGPAGPPGPASRGSPRSR